MLHIRQILFPTDRSRCAERAYAHAAYLARVHNARLHAVHVRAEGGAELASEDLLPLSLADVAAELDIPREQLTGDLDPALVEHAQIVSDSPGRGIVDYAEENHIDLIVMGTHGRGGADRLLAGSVAERVVREAPCPVLTVRGEGTLAVRRIVVPIDFSDRSKEAIPVAEDLADVYGAAIELVYVIDEDAVPPANVPLLGPVRVSADEVKTRFRKLMADLVREYQGRGEVSGTVVMGHPASDLLEHAEEHADLIVMSTHGRTGLKRLLLGSVAEKLVRRAPCPVFTIKSFGRDLTHER